MRQNTVSRTRKRQRGQTIILVAISLLSLLAVAALAIDVVTLYVARSEAQRAVDAAALAGAKAVADSGVTTLSPSDANLPNAVLLARSMSLAAVTAMLTANNPAINQIAGKGPTTWSQTVTFPATANPTNSNPHVTVTLAVSTLPTFFARIWGNGSATVTATATAEAYNPANVQLGYTPIAPRGVKPWLIANADPNNPGTQFVNPLTGVVEAGGIEVVGETINLSADCTVGLVNCVPIDPTLISSNGPRPQVDYVPALVTAPTVPNPNICPPCAGATDYEQSIECADMTTSYQVLSCGGGANNVTWDNKINPGGPGGLSEIGTECLIHAVGTGLGKGQDALNPPPVPPFSAPMQIVGGAGNPPQNGYLVTTSNSIVTIPIIDTRNPLPASGQPLTIVGFLQGFINEVHGNAGPAARHHGDIEVTILNVAGCSANPGVAAPIVGGSGTSPVPVRLITGP